jgi:hypothetical protein
MSKHQIKIIVEHSYKVDSYGNRYWLSRITNTRTGNSLLIDTPHSSNTNALIFEAGYDWRDIYECRHNVLTAKDYKWLSLKINLVNICKSPEIVTAIKRLNRVKKG